MSGVLYGVIDPRGVLYPAGGYDGGKATSLPVGAKIRQADIDKGNFTLGGLESLEKNGRVVRLDSDGLQTENKKMTKAEEKGAAKAAAEAEKAAAKEESNDEE